MVGVERLELPTFRSQAGRSSQTELRSDKRWWTWWDLNPRSPACKAGAFPSKLQAHKLVLQTGLEPVLYGLSFRFLYQDWDTGAYGAASGIRTRTFSLED